MYGIDLIFFYEILYDLFGFSSVDCESASDFLQLCIDRLECLSDETESNICLSEILDSSSIMNKNGKNLFRIFDRFDESSIIVKSEILTEDEEATIVGFLHSQSIIKMGKINRLWRNF